MAEIEWVTQRSASARGSPKNMLSASLSGANSRACSSRLSGSKVGWK
jgi:hypothetical protein